MCPDFSPEREAAVRVQDVMTKAAVKARLNTTTIRPEIWSNGVVGTTVTLLEAGSGGSQLRTMRRRSTASRSLNVCSSVPPRAPKVVTVRYHHDTNAQTKPISSATAAIRRTFRLTRASWRAPFSCHRAHRSSKVRASSTVSEGNWRAESPV
jgi:hypothetical protein